MRCRSCPHKAHMGICTGRSGGTAYACGCCTVTVPSDEVQSLRREVERLTAQVHDLTSRLTDSVLGRKKAEREVERLTKERDAAYAAAVRTDEVHARAMRSVRARAEKAEAQVAAHLESLETYEDRIHEIAADALGYQDPAAASIVLLDALERDYHRQRIARIQAEAQVERLRGALRECVHVHDGTHSEDCHAFGAGSDEDLDPEATSPDPHCDCGATAKRESFRAALADAKEDEHG